MCVYVLDYRVMLLRFAYHAYTFMLSYVSALVREATLVFMLLDFTIIRSLIETDGSMVRMVFHT